MSGAPKILYRLTWSWPLTPEQTFTALAVHEATMDLARVLESAGAIVDRTVAENPRVRPATAPQTDDDAADGGYHPDASDRAAMGRLARRAFSGGAGRAERD